MANKVITILSVALFAFVISTTVLAVENSDKAAEIGDLRAQLAAGPSEPFTTTTQSVETTTELGPATTTPSMETSPAVTTTTTTMATTTEAPSVSRTLSILNKPNSRTFGNFQMNYRLPEDNIPLHYDLYLYPHLEDGTFTGTVVIDVRTTKATDAIVLHSYELTIGRVQINSLNTTLAYLVCSIC